MQHTLSTGRVVEIQRPTMAQRTAAADAAEVVYEGTEVKFRNTFRANCLWAVAGLGLQNIDQLDPYSQEEIAELAKLAQAATTLDPTKTGGSE